MFVHYLPKIESRTGLADDVAHHRVLNKPAYFGNQITEQFGPGLGRGLSHFLFPKSAHRRIGHFLQFVSDEFFVGKDSRNFNYRSGVVRIGHQGQHRVPHVVLKQRADDFRRKEFVKNGNHFLNREIHLRRSSRLKHIQAHRPLHIKGFKQNYVVNPLPRNQPQYLFNGIAVRVKQGDSAPGVNVLDDQIFYKMGLTGAGLADDVKVAAPVFRGHSGDGFNASEKIFSQNQTFSWHIHRRRGEFRFQVLDLWRFYFSDRKMKHARQLLGV